MCLPPFKPIPLFLRVSFVYLVDENRNKIVMLYDWVLWMTLEISIISFYLWLYICHKPSHMITSDFKASWEIYFNCVSRYRREASGEWLIKIYFTYFPNKIKIFPGDSLNIWVLCLNIKTFLLLLLLLLFFVKCFLHKLGGHITYCWN